jgi:hypothetical protein
VDFIKCHWRVDRFPVRQTPRISKRIPMGLTEYFAQHNQDTVLLVFQELLQPHNYDYHGNNNANNNTNSNYNTSTGSDYLGSVHDLSTPVFSSSSPLSSVNVTIMPVSHFTQFSIITLLERFDSGSIFTIGMVGSWSQPNAGQICQGGRDTIA